MVEINNFLTGKIGGNCKTYEESFFVIIDIDDLHTISSNSKNNTIYYRNDALSPYFHGNGTPITILNIIPFTDHNNAQFIVEVIDSKILHLHLEQEKMIVEKLLSEDNSYKL